MSSKPVGKPEMGYRGALALLLVLFFSLGFLTALNDVLVAEFRAIFSLSYRAATMVQFAFFSGCFAASFPASRLLARVEHGRTMVVGLGVMAAGAFCFIGAARVAEFWAFLVALMVMAAGSSTLQTATGPYVSLMGERAAGPSRFSLALGVNSVGAMLGPAFGALVVLGRVHAVDSLAGPFAMIGVGLAGLAWVVSRSRLPRIGAEEVEVGGGSYAELLGRPRFVAGLGAMLVYVGAEIGIGSLLINFLSQPEILGVPVTAAAGLASLYWAGAMVGRFAGWRLLRRANPQRVLAVCGAAAVGLVMVSLGTHGAVAAGALLAVGLCNSVMVPIIFTTAISGLGVNTSRASGLMVGALIGGAVIPVCQGALADRVGIHASFWVPVGCYGVILGYGVMTGWGRRGDAA